MQLRIIFPLFVLVASAHAQLQQQRQPLFGNENVASGAAKFRVQFLDVSRMENSRRPSGKDHGQRQTASVDDSEGETGSSPNVHSTSLDRSWHLLPVDNEPQEQYPVPLLSTRRDFATKDRSIGDLSQPSRFDQSSDTRFHSMQVANEKTPNPLRKSATQRNRAIHQRPGKQVSNSEQSSNASNDDDGRTTLNAAASESFQNQDDIVFVESDNKAKSSDDAELSSGTSSLLRDSLLNRNPGLPPGLSASSDSNTQTSNLDLITQPAYHSALSSPVEASSSVGKRDGDSTHESDGGELDSGEDCIIPDVLVGDKDLPWTCRPRFDWRILGEHFYPSRLYEAVCEGLKCYCGHFNCTPISYTLHVLQACLHGCQDQRVPFALRSRWQWTDLDVNVGCQCVR